MIRTGTWSGKGRDQGAAYPDRPSAHGPVTRRRAGGALRRERGSAARCARAVIRHPVIRDVIRHSMIGDVIRHPVLGDVCRRRHWRRHVPFPPPFTAASLTGRGREGDASFGSRFDGLPAKFDQLRETSGQRSGGELRERRPQPMPLSSSFQRPPPPPSSRLASPTGEEGRSGQTPCQGCHRHVPQICPSSPPRTLHARTHTRQARVSAARDSRFKGPVALPPHYPTPSSPPTHPPRTRLRVRFKGQ